MTWTRNEALVIAALIAAGACPVSIRTLDDVHGACLTSAVHTLSEKLRKRFRNRAHIHRDTMGIVLLARGDILHMLFKEAQERLIDDRAATALSDRGNAAALQIMEAWA